MQYHLLNYILFRLRIQSSDKGVRKMLHWKVLNTKKNEMVDWTVEKFNVNLSLDVKKLCIYIGKQMKT